MSNKSASDKLVEVYIVEDDGNVRLVKWYNFDPEIIDDTGYRLSGSKLHGKPVLVKKDLKIISRL